ncbi:unnamed protein product [Diatraea saccharalis]|uniref:Uncharacterized protein n=1 Tax=Diatraea saccharalis TaxID=40085 RepID=A0A9N9RCW3_9NEOP|nr:unnamed protein product [Diatraea saccharalis]
MPKRKNKDSDDYIMRKIRKLEKKVRKRSQKRLMSSSPNSSDAGLSLQEVHLQFEDPNLQDYVLQTIVGNFVRGNFTPTSFEDRPCRDDQPYFVRRSERSKSYRFDDKLRTRKSERGYYFRPRYRLGRGARSVFKLKSRYRRRFLPARVVSGPLGDRNNLVLQWSLTDAVHVDGVTTVIFR